VPSVDIGSRNKSVCSAGLFCEVIFPYKALKVTISLKFNCLVNGILLKKKQLKEWSIINEVYWSVANSKKFIILYDSI